MGQPFPVALSLEATKSCLIMVEDDLCCVSATSHQSGWEFCS